MSDAEWAEVSKAEVDLINQESVVSSISSVVQQWVNAELSVAKVKKACGLTF